MISSVITHHDFTEVAVGLTWTEDISCRWSFAATCHNGSRSAQKNQRTSTFIVVSGSVYLSLKPNQ